jgi:hypothetical protein
MKLLEELCFGKTALNLEKDKLIFLGDMIDRGPDSKSVITEVKNLTEQCPKNVIALLGNHEDFMLQWYDMPNEDTRWIWEINGGKATLESYEAYAPSAWGPPAPHAALIPKEHIDWLKALPLSHEEPGFFFSHAPVPTEARRNFTNKGLPYTRRELIWTYNRDEASSANSFGDKIGVCGHVHRLAYGEAEPRFYPHYIFADAGCGCSEKAPLVAINVETREVLYARPT